MQAYEYNKNDERMMLRRTGIVEPIFLQMCGLCVITHLVTQEGSTMSNCKTCSQEISWYAQKREVFNRGPLNVDGTVNLCYKEQEAKQLDVAAALKWLL
jgi:hypothetical protein